MYFCNLLIFNIMKLNKWIFLIVLIQFFTSCVPYKKIVYVQGDMKQEKLDSSEYKIQKNDILYIKIKSANDVVDKIFNIDNVRGNNNVNSEALFFSGYTVDNNGYVELPVVKKIRVEGKTFMEVKEIIKQRLLAEQFKTLDDIFIQVKLAGVPYTIVGEVNNPHTGVLYKTKPNIFDVLSDSGDITLVGDRTEIIVMRKENGKIHKNTLDLTQAGVVNSPYYYVRPNDIVYVKPLRQKTLGTGTTLQQTISSTITALSLITTIILFTRMTKN